MFKTFGVRTEVCDNPPVVTSQTALSPDKTVRCHCVLVPVSSPLELKIDQLRESTVIKPSPLL